MAAIALFFSGLPGVGAAAARQAITVGKNLPVTATEFGVEEANNSPVMVEDPTDPRFVALASRLDAPDFSCALHVSGDGGRLWVPARPIPKLPRGADKCYAPEVAFDPQGTLLYLFLGLHGPGNTPMGAFLTTSSDRAGSFSSPRPILGPDGKALIREHDYMVRMAIDPSVGPRGRIHLTWLHALSSPPTGGLPDEANPILAAYSDDGGRTFSDPVRVSDPDRRRSVAPTLATGEDGVIHIAYYDLQDDAIDYQGLEGATWEGNWSLVTSTSTDGGKSFARGVVVDSKIVPPGRVMLIFTMAPAALAANGRQLSIAWPDARRGDPDIYLARSENDGRSWGTAQRLNDDRAGNGKHQSLPRLGMSPNGRIDAIFQDRRDDPANNFSHIYYTFSKDGSRRFSSNSMLTSRASDVRVGRTYPSIASARGLVESGSRLALLSRDSEAVAAWPDTRNGAVDRRQEIFSSHIALSEDSSRPERLPWLLVTALAIAGAVGSFVAWKTRR